MQLNSIQKCEHCEKWTDGNGAFCSHCGEILDQKFRNERWELDQRLKNLPGFMEWVTLKGADKNKLIFLFQLFIRSGQFILTLVVALITLILLLLPG